MSVTNFDRRHQLRRGWKDLSGQRCGRLSVLWPAGIGGKKCREIYWLCACDCGNYRIIRGGCLRNRHTSSCGCLHGMVSSVGKFRTTHERCRTPEFEAFVTARQRCTNPNNAAWRNYGGRGIQFLFSSFEEFFAEVGERPAGRYPSGRPHYTLDRKRNGGHYAPGNVRWATQKEQVHNRRRGLVKRLENFSDKKLIAECERRGWSVDVNSR